MDLPSAREIELETLLRERDAQVVELTDEVTHLRQYLSTQPPPSTTEPISLPPALVSLLIPHIHSSSSGAIASSTVTAALTQRAKVLQEENDELYELLKTGETGRLKEDVRALRRVVQKLETALKESHQVIASFSAELDKSHEAIMSSSRQANPPQAPVNVQAPTYRNKYPSHLPPAPNGSAKLPPTGPRAHKKPRLSESRTPPAPPNLPLPPTQRQSYNSHTNSVPPQRDTRDRREPDERKLMDVDNDDQRSKLRSPERGRGRDRGDRDRDRDRDGPRDRDRKEDRERDRDRERERDRNRDRERDRGPRRNGRNRRGGGGRGTNNGAHDSADRTLAERMGL